MAFQLYMDNLSHSKTKQSKGTASAYVTKARNFDRCIKTFSRAHLMLWRHVWWRIWAWRGDVQFQSVPRNPTKCTFYCILYHFQAKIRGEALFGGLDPLVNPGRPPPPSVSYVWRVIYCRLDLAHYIPVDTTAFEESTWRGKKYLVST